MPVGKVGGRSDRQQDNQTPFLRRASLYLGVAFELPEPYWAAAVGYLLTTTWYVSLVIDSDYSTGFCRSLREIGALV
jgi:hypothetical protein